MRQTVPPIILLAIFGFCYGDHYHPKSLKKPATSNLKQKFALQLDAAYWEQQGATALQYRLQNLTASGWSSSKSRRARNVILFLGDGMGVTTVSAIRKMKQQLTGTPYYENRLTWDSFPHSGFSMTYSVDDVIPDSATTATAYLSGVKSNSGYIGIDATADLDCSTQKGYVDSIGHWAVAAGKKAGFVTTTRITHASPAPLYSHTPWRDNEMFANVTAQDFGVLYPKCVDIAQQLVTSGKHLSVALGGGRRNFLPTAKGGLRNDGRDLTEEWLNDRTGNQEQNAVYVQTLDQLKAINSKNTDFLLGLFSSSHLDYVDNNPKNQPRLADMTEAAIKVLSNHQQGYFLFVEGGRIDHGHHDGIARYALTEGVEFDAAVEKALSMVDLKDTLVIVTADHSHTLTMGGSLRNEDNVLTTSYEIADDQKTYTSLAYANGPGANKTLEGPNAPAEGTRKNVSSEKAVQSKYLQQATVSLDSETHGGEDVGVYAIGVNSEYFSGVFEQSYIAWSMACASGIYGYPDSEQWQRLSKICPPDADPSNSASPNNVQQSILMLGAAFIISKFVI